MGKFQDLTGQRFGRLVAIRQLGKSPYGAIKWLCQCDCGNQKQITAQSLKSGAVKSCGCLHRETAAKRGAEMLTKHGESKSRLYGVWLAMRRRCNNPKTDAYKWYGARGISVCDEWQKSYEAFRLWALENGYDETAPRGKCTLDRIDPDKDYSPSNCRWVTQKEQTRNTRANRIVTYHGKEMPIAVLSDKTGIPYNKLQARITALGWSAEKAVETPFHTEK